MSYSCKYCLKVINYTISGIHLLIFVLLIYVGCTDIRRQVN